MQSAPPLASLSLSLAFLLTACESTGFRYGYVNQLKETVTVVERYRKGVDTSTFSAGYSQEPTPGGSVAESVEFFDARRRPIAIFTRADYRRSGRSGLPPVLVISRSGVHLASRNLWQKMAVEWDGPLPSHPVSYGGGDGSSCDKAIVVHASDAQDHITGVYAYMRKHFGYMWTYKSMARYFTGAGADWCDVYEFETQDGRKHTLYFRDRETSKGI
jgi:hypothetical protein